MRFLSRLIPYFNRLSIEFTVEKDLYCGYSQLVARVTDNKKHTFTLRSRILLDKVLQTNYAVECRKLRFLAKKAASSPNYIVGQVILPVN